MIVMHLRRIVIASICLFPIQIAIAQLPQNSRHAGGIAVIPIYQRLPKFSMKKPILIAQEGLNDTLFLEFLFLPIGNVKPNNQYYAHTD
jgi:hypothetical protein